MNGRPTENCMETVVHAEYNVHLGRIKVTHWIIHRAKYAYGKAYLAPKYVSSLMASACQYQVDALGSTQWHTRTVSRNINRHEDEGTLILVGLIISSNALTLR